MTADSSTNSLAPAPAAARAGDDEARQHLPRLIERYTRRTARSKAYAAEQRALLADKSSIGFAFTPETKEMCYPIVCARAEGARLWDIDGNEYLDILQGLGTNLFGHNPSFVREALAARLHEGFPIGPQSELVGHVAQLVTELTGMTRVAFSNTGTEAVMTALRVARTATRRSRIALFTNSYHGHADVTLMRAPLAEYARKKLLRAAAARPWLAPLRPLLERGIAAGAVPAAPGIPAAVARDVLVLDYGNPRSLDLIRRQRGQLAAVLVEPVQSRCPELQPEAFLRELRALTREIGSLLVFDEMVTGFRVVAGGAQAHFGIEADLATYSKVVGGGLPLSVIAGRGALLDHIDGGPWRYGDDSAPRTQTTFFAGTFCKHPLALAAAQATLLEIKMRGPDLYAALNARTAALVARLNGTVARRGLPLEFTSFGSFFAVAATRSAWSPLASTLFSYHLLERGVFLRGGDKGGFLSTVHTDADVDRIAAAIEDSLDALHAAGLL